LEVKILGFTEAARQRAASTQSEQSAKVIGRWSDNAIGAIYTIVQEGAGIRLVSRYSDGSVGDDTLRSKVVNGQERLYIQGSGSGDYLVIGNDGRLGQYDSNGLIIRLPSAQ
jgi:hypothetical protein